MSHLNLQQSAQITVDKRGESSLGAFEVNYLKSIFRKQSPLGPANGTVILTVRIEIRCYTKILVMSGSAFDRT